MSSRIFTLGASPDLALEELKTVFSRIGINLTPQPLNRHQYLLNFPQLSAQNLMDQLGGTVKIGQVEATIQDLQKLIGLFPRQSTPWALSSFDLSQSRLKTLAQSLKNTQFTTKSRRFRILTSPLVSSGISQKFTEWQLIKHQNEWLLVKTLSVQPISHWGEKDYGRPYVDPASGMLPPKIARILINFAFPQTLNTNQYLLDPFCGSGTILMEALDLGLSAHGSDISQKAVDQARANLDWFIKKFNPPGSVSVSLKDVTQLRPTDFHHSPDAIVFEGYLGPPNLKAHQVDNYIRGLTKLYRGAFKKLSQLQPAGTRLVAALPEYYFDNRVKNLDNLVDSCEKWGYTRLRSPLVYGRPHATIKRSIQILRKD